jgi:DNA primase
MFDGDEAGRKAAQTLKPLIEEDGFVVEIVNLNDDTDPGELDQDDVNSIREYINK